MVEENLEQLEEIHERYEDERLDYLVGAGASIDAGLPKWDELNNRLLRDFFNEKLSREPANADEVHIQPEPDELAALAEVFTDRLGRDSVMDLVQDRMDEDAFHKLLRSALYRRVGDAELKPLQFELAATIDGTPPKRLLTTNFDDLLERAYCRLHGLSYKQEEYDFEIVATEGGLGVADQEFVHLHGFLPPNNAAAGEIVLSEQDFWESSESWATEVLEETLFEEERDLLVVGMSLGDPRLRQVLFDRAQQDSDSGRVFVLLDKETPTRDMPLAQRRAYRFLSHYEEQYWQELDVDVFFVENFELLPLYLRQIRLGNAPDEWCKEARGFLQNQSDDGDCVFDSLHEPAIQNSARGFLDTQLQFIRRKFEVPRDEHLTIGFFVPSPEPERNGDYEAIRLVFRYTDGFSDDKYEISTGEHETFQGVPVKHGRKRELRVNSVGEAQGAAGYAFVTGALTEARHSSPELNRNFDREMHSEWDGGRTFSSLLCVPIYGSKRWVPLGVAFLSSNRRDPFWAGFSSERSLNLNSLLRASFRELLGYEEQRTRGD